LLCCRDITNPLPYASGANPEEWDLAPNLNRDTDVKL